MLLFFCTLIHYKLFCLVLTKRSQYSFGLLNNINLFFKANDLLFNNVFPLILCEIKVNEQINTKFSSLWYINDSLGYTLTSPTSPAQHIQQLNTPHHNSDCYIVVQGMMDEWSSNVCMFYILIEKTL